MKCVLVLTFLINTISLKGQNSATFLGSVLDSTHNPLEYADAYLFRNKNLIAYTQIVDGNFEFKDLRPGMYKLQIHCLGFKSIQDSIEIVDRLINQYIIQREVNLLDEIQVSATKNPISTEGGHVKVQVANTIFAQSVNLLEMLALLPQMHIDPSGESIQIVGRGRPLIYLDEQRINMDQLLALNIREIEHIEIIQNPSAKYEAEGNSIIVITLIRNREDGMGGLLRESISIRRKFNNYLNGDLYGKKRKLTWRTNLAYNHLGFWESNASTYSSPSPSTLLESENLATGLRPQVIAGGGLGYQFNESTSIHAHINTRLQEDNFPIVTNNSYETDEQVLDFNTRTENSARRKFFNANVSLDKNLGSHEIFMGGSYGFHLRDLFNDIYFIPQNLPEQYIQRRGQIYKVHTWNGRMDYVHSISQNVKLEVGYNGYRAQASAFSDFEFLENSEKTISNYDYDEKNQAGYLQVTGEVRKWDYVLGVRPEWTQVFGKFAEVDSALIDLNQLNIFPRLQLGRSISEYFDMRVNFGTTIRRPHILNASSISTFLNPWLEFSRNPNLKPEIREEASVHLDYKNHNLVFRYANILNPTFFALEYNEQEDVLVSSPQNFDRQRQFTATYTWPFNIKSLNTTAVLQMNWNEIKDRYGRAGLVRPYAYYYLNNRYDFGKKFSAGVNLWGMTKRYEGVFERNALFVINLNLIKTWKHWTVSLQANDILRGMIYIDQYVYNQIDAIDKYFIDQKGFMCSITYLFGKNKSQDNKDVQVDDQINRIQ